MPEQNTPETVLVAGAAGFIGLHLCRALLDRGSRVVALDNFSTGDREALTRLAQESTTNGSRGLSIAEQDISGPQGVGHAVDAIVNLACPASPVSYRRLPLETFEASVSGVRNLLAWARVHGAKFLQASTSEVYGDPFITPQVETYPGYVDSMSDRACYVEGKRSAETLINIYRQQFNVDTRIARIFNSYGPGMSADDGRVVSTFIGQVLADLPMTVHGTGSQTRSLCYVSDTVAGLLAMLDHPGPLGYPINIGNPDEISVINLAHEISQMINPGKFPQIHHVSRSYGDPCRRCPDVSAAQVLIGWEPVVPRADGLSKTVDWMFHTRSIPPVSDLDFALDTSVLDDDDPDA